MEKKSSYNLTNIFESSTIKNIKILIKGGITMNKSGKVFLIISIILAIILIIMTYLYFNALNSLRASLDNSVNNSDILLKTNQAIEDAGFEIQIQEDGSFKLIEEQI